MIERITDIILTNPVVENYLDDIASKTLNRQQFNDEEDEEWWTVRTFAFNELLNNIKNLNSVGLSIVC